MWADIPAMAPCAARESGRHSLSAILPGEDSGDISLFCDACGAIRRVAASGNPYPAQPIDELTTEQIEAVIYGRKRS